MSFVAENNKNESNIKRIYYGVVSDALETGFSFKGLQADVVIPLVGEEASYSDILKASMDMEENIMGFYEKAAGLSNFLAHPKKSHREARSTQSAEFRRCFPRY